MNMRIDTIQMVPLDQLVPYEKNNKIHDFRIICGSDKIKIPPTP